MEVLAHGGKVRGGGGRKNRMKGERMVAAFGEEVWVPKRS